MATSLADRVAFLVARPNRQISKRPPEQYLAEIAAEHSDRLEAQCNSDGSEPLVQHFQSIADSGEVPIARKACRFGSSPRVGVLVLWK